MPIPRIVRQWNRAGLNRVTKHVAPWAPGFGVVIHLASASGLLYQTPVSVFPAEDGYVFALTHGPDTTGRTSWPRAVASCGRADAPSG